MNRPCYAKRFRVALAGIRQPYFLAFCALVILAATMAKANEGESFDHDIEKIIQFQEKSGFFLKEMKRESATTVIFFPDSRFIAAGYRERFIRVWDVGLRKLVDSHRRVHGGPIFSVDVSPDGKQVISGNRTPLLWNLIQRRKNEFEGHEKTVSSVLFSPDGKTIATGSFDGTVRTWDAETGRIKRVFQLQPGGLRSGWITALTFSRSGEYLYAGAKEKDTQGAIYRLDVQQGGHTLVSETPSKTAVDSLAVSPRDEFLAVGEAAGIVRFWSIGEKKWIFKSEIARGWITAVDFAPDGRTIVCGSNNLPFLGILEIATGTPILWWKGEISKVYDASYSPDGATVAAATATHGVLVWKVVPDKKKLKSVSELTPERFYEIWNDGLCFREAGRAYAYMLNAVAAGDRFVSMLKDVILTSVTEEILKKWVKQLDDESFKEREKAREKLEEMIVYAEPILHRVSTREGSSREKQHRANSILEKSNGPIIQNKYLLRRKRTIEILEWIGTEKARALLMDWHDLTPSEREKAEIRDTLNRLKK